MARYKVLQSVAHAMARSIVTATTQADSDYAACHLLAHTSAHQSLSIVADLLTRRIAPASPYSEPLASAVDRFARNLGRLVTENGAALDMVSVAEVHLTVERTVEGGAHPVRGHITARARIVDDRGREYVDTFVNPLLCVGIRWDAL